MSNNTFGNGFTQYSVFFSNLTGNANFCCLRKKWKFGLWKHQNRINFQLTRLFLVCNTL